jgi:hypothetical protein
MHPSYQPLPRDGCGDDGERLRLVATVLAERGWSDDAIRERVMTDPACVHPAYDDLWVQLEIEACISSVRPLEPKLVAAKKKVTQVSGDGLPGWLRDRIESVAIPADRDLYFRDIVAALARRGWDCSRITIEIAGRPWVPERYAGHALEYGVRLLLMVVPLRIAPDDVAASDVRAAQRAIAAGRWRESVQAKNWAGHAVAAVMKLDAEADKAKIIALLKIWIESGALVVVEGEDEQRKKRSFVEVGSVAE